MNDIKPFNVTKKNPAYAIILIIGGDNDLNDYIEKDMQEMLTGMSDDMSVLCLVDYLDRTAEVIELTKAGRENSIEKDWGEINTGDPDILGNFLSRALATYSKDAKIAIGFWSHGSGVFDENHQKIVETFNTLNALKSRSPKTDRLIAYRINDKKSLNLNYGRMTIKSLIVDHTNKDILSSFEAGRMFNFSVDRKVNMIFSDTCLNGMIEVMHELKKHADVIVASTDLEPGDGWDYRRWFDKMAAASPVDSASWAKQAVDAFEESYKDKTDLHLHPCTLGAFRTGNNLAQTFKELIEAIDAHGRTGWHWMQEARQNTQSFSTYATYDLFHFTQNLLIVLEEYGANAEAVKEKAQALADAFQKCRVHSVALGEKVRHHSHGLGFWFPYEKAIFMKDVESYSGLSFDKDTGWTSYLKKHYSVE